VRRLRAEETDALLRLLGAEVAPRLAVQDKGYARGRQSAWLAWEPSFDAGRAWRRPTGSLWTRLCDLVPGCELAECFRNGAGSSPGIKPHRDAPYAERTAWLVNLGPTTFRIWLPHGSHPAPGVAHVASPPGRRFTEHRIPLAGGEVLRFDCKLLHGSATTAEERWAVGLWTFKPAWRAAATFHDDCPEPPTAAAGGPPAARA
jgi:hypothetical protein